MTRLDDKLMRIRSGAYRRSDFIIADAKDPDMGPGLHAVGPARPGEARFKTRAEFLDSIEAIVKQDIVDIMLTSVSNLEQLVKRKVFAGTGVKPAIRANDTTDVWRHRGGAHHLEPSRPFRSASLKHVRRLTDLGLYSITFTNDTAADHASLAAFRDFRADAEANRVSYFLEVFNPNVERGGLNAETMPGFINDSIVRALAGLTEAERPRFLKVAYNGPKALEELASFDPGLVVGVLGGGAGTTRDCFELLHQAEKYGARVALFGRKINLAESPLDIVRLMRAVANGDVTPLEAVKAYHAAVVKQGLKPMREIKLDSAITEPALKQA
jgi:hypothetical protein